MNLQFNPGSAFRPPILALGDVGDVYTNVAGSAIQGYGTATAIGGGSTGAIIGAAQAGLTSTVAIMMSMGMIPVVGPIIAGIAALIGPIASLFKGCGQTCIMATKIADQAGVAQQQIVDYYWSQPVHYYSVQQAALKGISDIATAINQACSNPALGEAGQRCISERTVRGGTAPWCPTPDHTGCDIWTAYYDPIAHDPAVVPDPVAATSDPAHSDTLQAGLAQLSSGTGISAPILLIGGGLLALFLLAD